MERKDPKNPAFAMPEDAMGMNAAMKLWTKEAAAMLGSSPAASNPFAAPMAMMNAANALAFAAAGQAFRLWFDATRALWGDRPSVEDLEHATADSMEFIAYGAEPEGVLEGDDAPVAPKAKKTAKSKKKAPAAERVVDAAPKAVAEPAPAEVAALMPEDFRPPRKIERPGTPDELKRIAGIGPKAEKLLNSLGVWTFAQVAEWTAEEIAWVDDFMALGGRIGRDGWVAQAAELARGGAVN